MNGFFKSFQPMWKKLQERYLIELILLIVAGITAVISVIIYLKNWQLINNDRRNIDIKIANEDRSASRSIFVDLAGAVENPDVYEVSFGARLKDVLVLAGGLSAAADRTFFSRNFNLARIVNDQEKIYIPAVNETPTTAGNQNQPLSINQQINNSTSSTNLININSASIEALDTLPGIGKITAEKIIRNRPYQTIDELLLKKVVSKTVYEKIKSSITVN